MKDSIEDLEYKVRWLATALDRLARDHIQAGMAEYQAKPSELIAQGKWMLGLLDELSVTDVVVKEAEQ